MIHSKLLKSQLKCGRKSSQGMANGHWRLSLYTWTFVSPCYMNFPLTPILQLIRGRGWRVHRWTRDGLEPRISVWRVQEVVTIQDSFTTCGLRHYLRHDIMSEGRFRIGYQMVTWLPDSSLDSMLCNDRLKGRGPLRPRYLGTFIVWTFFVVITSVPWRLLCLPLPTSILSLSRVYASGSPPTLATRRRWILLLKWHQ